MIPGATHSIDYKGYTIVFANNQYHLALYPKKKYFNLGLAKVAVDKLAGPGETAVNNLSTILKRKPFR